MQLAPRLKSAAWRGTTTVPYTLPPCHPASCSQPLCRFRVRRPHRVNSETLSAIYRTPRALRDRYSVALLLTHQRWQHRSAGCCHLYRRAPSDRFLWVLIGEVAGEGDACESWSGGAGERTPDPCVSGDRRLLVRPSGPLPAAPGPAASRDEPPEISAVRPGGCGGCGGCHLPPLPSAAALHT